MSILDKLIPDVYLVGAAKSGTSGLAYLLSEHPSINVGKNKEPEYFSFCENFEKGESWYLNNYKDAKQEQTIIDASTGYSRYPEYPDVAKRIHDFNPDAKIIFLLRHPVDRAYSHYIHRYSKELFPDKPFEGTFSSFIEREPMVVNSSNYKLQIQQYLKYFDKSSILVIFTDEMNSNLSGMLTNVCDFLLIDAYEVTPIQIVKNDTDGYLASRARVKFTNNLNQYIVFRLLRAFFSKRLKNFIFSVISSTMIFKKVKAQFEPPKLTKEERQMLIMKFKKSNAWVEEFSRTKLPKWDK